MKHSPRTSRRLVAGLAVGSLVLAACGSDSNDATEDSVPAEEVEAGDEEAGTIVDVAAGAGTFETLVAAVTAADLAGTLSSEGPFTVFAPTDDAFAALPDGLVEALLLPENVDALQAILTYHVLGAEVPSSDVAPGDVETVQGESITIAADGDMLTVNDATITAVDVEASNGVIHVIDAVLVPPSIDPAALLEGDAMEDDAMEEEAMEEDAMEEEAGTIVDVAAGAGTFETLVAAVTAADLAGTLSSEGPFTVFAPTDDAFAALPDGLVEALLLPENVDALQAILTYHVLGAEVPSSDVAPGDVETVQGESITIAADGDTLTVNDATITAVDVEASNGVIHVIDAVLVPPSIDPAALLEGDDGDEEAAAEGTIVEVAEAAGTFTTLLAAAEAAGIDGVLNGPGAFTIFAPTDEAFEALPDGLLDALLLPENSATLTAILTYHGLAAEVPSSDVAAGDVATIQGEDITISIDGDVIMVNDATITAVDVEASNGVIHVLDSVLVPPSIDVTTLLG